MDITKAAANDVLRHNKMGLVSYRPAICGDEDIGIRVPVRDINFKLHFVNESELTDEIILEDVIFYRKTVISVQYGIL